MAGYAAVWKILTRLLHFARKLSIGAHEKGIVSSHTRQSIQPKNNEPCMTSRIHVHDFYRQRLTLNW